MQRLEDKRAYDDAIPYARRRLELDPLDESALEQLMRLYLLSGNRSAALNAYQEFADTLDRELGVEPSDEAQLAYTRALDSGAVDVQAVPARARADGLVGREEEWKLLRASWQRVLQGRAQFVAITGEAGIGKTRG